MREFLWIAIIILVIALVFIIAASISLEYWEQDIPTTKCSSDSGCEYGQICWAGVCEEVVCFAQADCRGGSCISSYCDAPTCITGNDCAEGLACESGICIPVGSSCASNADCAGVSCVNRVCAQCLSDSTCPTGQGCFQNSCRYPYGGETGLNVINYPSPANANGNVVAPPGYFCLGTVCGTGPNLEEPISCVNQQECPESCPFCVNSKCRCTKGANLETCKNNSDCESGICNETIYGKSCVPVGGKCVFNYSSNGPTGSCPVNKPYCVDGTCSAVSLGAVCGATGMPYDLCRNRQALGAPGTTGISPNGMGFFCSNGKCQETPGDLNALCSAESCLFSKDGVLSCLPVNNRGVAQMRCGVS